MQRKKKILMLSDHALSTSGVGVQSRFLIQGLIDKGCWTVRQFGAAIKHTNYETTVVNDDFIIKPIDGFGNKELIRQTLAAEKPDVVLLFTDPRFFLWLFEIEDEIHRVCPIAYWHVWDNYPAPKYNDVIYDSCDLINCHSYLTYQICSEFQPSKTNFVPHSLPEDLYFPMEQEEIKTLRETLIGPERVDHFIGFWCSRNAKRKRPADMLWAWSIFMKQLKENHGHEKATLLMHTDPLDGEGPNLMSVVDQLGINESVVFSNERVEFENMNALHNIADVTLSTSYAEGFGLTTLESMQTATPIIAPTTGGLTRQVVDHRDGTENGVALPIELQSMVGSQNVPYIFEDYVSAPTIAGAIMKVYNWGPEKRKQMGQKARDYALSEFAHQKTIDLWHDTLTDLTENWKTDYRPWSCEVL